MPRDLALSYMSWDRNSRPAGHAISKHSRLNDIKADPKSYRGNFYVWPFATVHRIAPQTWPIQPLSSKSLIACGSRR
jgi:hypothetical protein